MESKRLQARLGKAELLAALNKTFDATKAGKSPALKCYLLILDEPGRLQVEATDLEISIGDSCPVLEAESFGRILIPATAFKEIVKKLPEDELELEELDNFRLEIRSGESLSRLAGYNPADFPAIPRPEGEPFKVWAADLQELASAVVHAICKDETKINILGLRAQWVKDESGGVLLGVATDGHRLALASKRIEDPAPAFARGVTIPGKGIDAIKKLEGALSVYLTDRALHIVQGDLCLAIRLLEGEFPDPRAVIPTDLPSIMAVNREELADAVDRVGLLASKNEVLLKLEGETLLLKAESEKGEALDSLVVNCDCPGVEVKLDARYLLDAVGSLGGDEVFIKYRDGISSILLLPSDLSGFDERVLVLMPRYNKG